MTAQSYKDPIARRRMQTGMCPECGMRAEAHTGYWAQLNVCGLRPEGVLDRIEQYRSEEKIT